MGVLINGRSHLKQFEKNPDPSNSNWIPEPKQCNSAKGQPRPLTMPPKKRKEPEEIDDITNIVPQISRQVRETANVMITNMIAEEEAQRSIDKD